MKRFLLILGAACFAVTASAATLSPEYTSFSNWSAAVGGYSTETFDGNWTVLSTPTLTGSGHIGTGITTTSSWMNPAWHDRLQNLTPSPTTTFNAASGTFSSFGFYYDLGTAGFYSGIKIDVIFVDTTVLTAKTFTVTGSGFLGFTADTNIAGIRFSTGVVPGATSSSGAETYELANFSIGGNAGSAIPEPGTFALGGLALLGLGMIRRKRSA